MAANYVRLDHPAHVLQQVLERLLKVYNENLAALRAMISTAGEALHDKAETGRFIMYGMHRGLCKKSRSKDATGDAPDVRRLPECLRSDAARNIDSWKEQSGAHIYSTCCKRGADATSGDRHSGQ